jgi:primosomal protein N' (replication factor Y)
MKFLKIAIPRPLDRLFDYEYSVTEHGPVFVGDWVSVPFGRSKLIGCVIEISDERPVMPEGVELKSVTSRIPEAFSLPKEVVQICKFGSEFYQYPIGEAFFSAMPPSPDRELGTRKSKESPIEPKQIILNEEQQKAVDQVEEKRLQGLHPVFLLEGITGSGKSEVYIELAKRNLTEGKSVLILVPEIALTAQLKDRFEKSIGETVALWHSALADGLRQVQWRKIKNGEIRVVIGARSAVFAPMKDLGLIIVDEEHDQTYKQEERFRYQARDLAVYRGHHQKVPVVLGSATPSLESIHRVKEGRYLYLTLTKRYSGQMLPEIHLIRLNEEQMVIHEKVKTPFAERTVQMMQETIDRGEQVIVYLNRRGFSQFILCQDCGWIKECPQCSITLTHYQRKNELRCHVCGWQEPVPSECEQCGSYGLQGMGFGTESLEDELKILLPDSKVMRLDRDQITSQKRLEETLDGFRRGDANILIGTQMLVKGHDFAKVTCVVVVSADMLLRWPDFRSTERALQTLTQVAGRAGRAELPGRVLIQGYDLDHSVIQVLCGEQPLDHFIEQELELRKALNYPPFSRFVRFRFQHKNESQLRTKVERMVAHLEKESEYDRSRLMGPSEALLFKANTDYRFDLYYKAPTIDSLMKLSKKLKAMANVEEIELVVDVDPYTS